jgi:hypothetical protein
LDMFIFTTERVMDTQVNGSHYGLRPLSGPEGYT